MAEVEREQRVESDKELKIIRNLRREAAGPLSLEEFLRADKLLGISQRSQTLQARSYKIDNCQGIGNLNFSGQ